MSRKCAPFPIRMPILEEAPQCEFDTQEGDVLPRDFAFVIQAHFEALGADPVVRIEQSGTKGDVDLMGANDVDNAQQRADLNARQRFLHGLSSRSVLNCLAVLQETGGNGPVTQAWLNGALT